MTKLADKQGSGLSMYAEAVRSCLSAPTNLIKVLKAAHCLEFNTWQFGSMECEQLNHSTVHLYFPCYPPDPWCVTMQYSVPYHSISALVSSGSGSWVACLSITLYVHGHGLVLTY